MPLGFKYISEVVSYYLGNQSLSSSAVTRQSETKAVLDCLPLYKPHPHELMCVRIGFSPYMEM